MESATEKTISYDIINLNIADLLNDSNEVVVLPNMDKTTTNERVSDTTSKCDEDELSPKENYRKQHTQVQSKSTIEPQFVVKQTASSEIMSSQTRLEDKVLSEVQISQPQMNIASESDQQNVSLDDDWKCRTLTDLLDQQHYDETRTILSNEEGAGKTKMEEKSLEMKKRSKKPNYLPDEMESSTDFNTKERFSKYIAEGLTNSSTADVYVDGSIKQNYPEHETLEMPAVGLENMHSIGVSNDIEDISMSELHEIQPCESSGESLAILTSPPVRKHTEIVKALTAQIVELGDDALFECQLSKSNTVTWLKDSEPITQSSKHDIIQDGTFHKMVVQNVEQSDIGEYTIKVGDVISGVTLEVEGTGINNIASSSFRTLSPSRFDFRCFLSFDTIMFN